MTTQTEALKLALEALESCGSGHITDGGNQWYDEKLVDNSITAIKEALAQPEPSPEWMTEEEQTAYTFGWFKALEAQRTWVGLTKKEVHDLYDLDYAVFHQRIEAKLKENNA